MLKKLLIAVAVFATGLTGTAYAHEYRNRGDYWNDDPYYRDYRDHRRYHRSLRREHREAHRDGFYSRRDHRRYHRALRREHRDAHDYYYDYPRYRDYRYDRYYGW